MLRLSTFILNFTSKAYICRRDKKAIQHYDFLWEVMEENLKGTNKKKCLSQVETPSPLLKLCFQTMRKYDVAKVLLVPFRLKKTNSAVNTEMMIQLVSSHLATPSIQLASLAFWMGILHGLLVLSSRWLRLVAQATPKNCLMLYLCIIM